MGELTESYSENGGNETAVTKCACMDAMIHLPMVPHVLGHILHERPGMLIPCLFTLHGARDVSSVCDFAWNCTCSQEFLTSGTL